jgi:acyl carrier protein
METLLNELRHKVIETLNLVDITPDDIDGDDPFIGGKLGIDSIDILELVMMIERDYLVKIDNKEVGAKVFASLKSMADHIYEHSPRLSR